MGAAAEFVDRAKRSVPACVSVWSIAGRLTDGVGILEFPTSHQPLRILTGGRDTVLLSPGRTEIDGRVGPSMDPRSIALASVLLASTLS